MKNTAIRTIATAAVAAGLVVGMSGCAGAVSAGGAAESGSCASEDITLVQSGRGLDNEYYVSVDAAAKAFAEAEGLGANYQWIASDGDSSKQLSQIKSILAKGGECVVLNVDANESSLVPAIVKEAENAGAWLVTQWNRPDGTAPETGDSSHWVAHMSVDGVPQGYDVAKALFESMGGEGSIIALQGILDNPPAKERFEGLQKALDEYPGITLLEEQSGDWDRIKGQDITQTFLTKYPGQIGGVWAASDSMGLGALEAIRNAGQAGAIKVVSVDGLSEAIDLVKDPTSGYIATTQSSAAAQGAFGLAIGMAAATGAFSPADEPVEHRSFYLKPLSIITAENADSVPDPSSTDGFDFADIWSEAGTAIR